MGKGGKGAEVKRVNVRGKRGGGGATTSVAAEVGVTRSSGSKSRRRTEAELLSRLWRIKSSLNVRKLELAGYMT